jgi:ribulose-5-phosphate 4-epimerase/fuculose-1-phosphate aldolase
MQTEQNAVKIAQAVRILHGLGLLEVFGHVSSRGDTQSCHILGHLHVAGRTLATTIPDDIVKVDLNGRLLKGETSPPGEVYIHTEIYKKRRDINAIVHAHGLACIALSTLEQEVLPLWAQATPFYQGTPIFGLPEQIDNSTIGKQVAEVLSDKRAVLLKGHGVVVVGNRVEEACVLAIILERTARMQLEAAALGQPKPIPAEVLVDGMTRGLTLSELVDSYWEYWTAQFPLH